MTDGADPYDTYLDCQERVGKLRVQLESAEWDLEEAKVEYEFHRQRAIDALRASNADDPNSDRRAK